jgi:DNA-binding ferritin-like protein
MGQEFFLRGKTRSFTKFVMKAIATLLRALQLYAHNAHNLASGCNFLQDHEFLGELYPAYEGEYDSVVERMIGMDMELDLPALNCDACDIVSKAKTGDCCTNYKVLLATEKSLCVEIKKVVGSCSTGTQNLLQGIADNSEMRQYKFKRLTK